MTSRPKRAKRSAKSKLFQRPLGQTIVGRSSSITNAFVNSLLPSIEPSSEEVDEALRILGMTPKDLHCIYCGDACSEWDHLRPLVLGSRPTGYISEIANLVPSCGKCNQSKGNKDWRTWMLSEAPRSPSARGVADVLERVQRIELFVQWRQPTRIDFESILGSENWRKYWAMYVELLEGARRCQEFAQTLKKAICDAVTPR